MDCPDGNQFYWHDLRKEPQYYSKRVAGGGSVMVWTAFGYRGKTELIFVEGRQNSNSYIELLQNHLVPNGVLIGGPSWIFQQDTSSVHASEVVRNWFREHGIRVLD